MRRSVMRSKLQVNQSPVSPDDYRQFAVDGDAVITFEEVQQTAKVPGIVAEISELSPEVVEVAVALQSPLQYRPGQYVRVKFAGFQPRQYSPTCGLDGTL